MDIKPLKTTSKVDYKGRSFIVTIYEQDLKEIEDVNWRWESLLFPTNDCEIVRIEEIGSNNVLILDTFGKIRVDDKKGNSLDIEDIYKFAKQGTIYEDYDVIYSNWFSINYYKNNKDKLYYIEDFSLEYEPNSREDLIMYLLDDFVGFFY